MNKTTRNQIILLILILAIAAFFRFYKLAEVPPGLYPDVAINGNDAAAALETGDFRVFYPENNGREGLFINLIAFSFSLFGISVWAIKAVSAITGLLAVLGMYLMLKELFRGKKQANAIALLSSFFLAISFWHIVFSRLGFRAIMVPFFLVWGFYCLFRGINMARAEENLQTGSQDRFFNAIRVMRIIGYWILTGLLFGLGFHTYISYRFVPAIWLIVLLIEIYKQGLSERSAHYKQSLSERSAHYNYWPRFKSFVINNLWYWGIGILAIIFAALPIVFYFYHNPQDFMGRSAQVSIFASESPVRQLAVNTIKTLGMFNVRGDCNWRHNYACQPELFWPVGILFLIGIAIALKQFFWGLFSLRRRQTDDNQDTGWSPAQISLFLLSWFFALLLPEILSNEGLPHSLRAIGAIPPVFIFSGMGGIWTVEKLKTVVKSNIAVFLIIFLFLIILVAQSYEYYFIDWGKNPEAQGAYTQNFVNIGNYLNTLPADAKKYVIVNEGGVPVPFPDGIPMPAQTVMFVQRAAGKEVNTFYLKPEEVQNFQGANPTLKYSIYIVLMKYDENIFNKLKEKFPQGEILNQNNIWSFQIFAESRSASGGEN